MNLKSGKFVAYERGKLVALARVHFAICQSTKYQIYSALNSHIWKLRTRELCKLIAVTTGRFIYRVDKLEIGRDSNFSRRKLKP